VEHLDELLVCRLDFGRKVVEPCTIVIFGASGDLTARKLIPAFYHLFGEKQLPSPFRIVGFARREKSDAQWREELKTALDTFSRTKPVNEEQWAAFSANLSYCQGEFSDLAAYQKLEKQLTEFGNEQLRRNLVFYLSTSPSQFAEVAEHLHHAKLLQKKEAGGFWQRVVVEKPFGHDLASAQQLNAELTRFAHEAQIFRIDHYLGKETVQNILMFRFSNSIFEQLWNRQSVDHLQITLSEKLGVGSRGGYY
jgi:glucose-6-phosphate 1-dehydrogenase